MNAMAKAKRREELQQKFDIELDAKIQRHKAELAYILRLDNQKKKHPTLFKEELL